MSWLTAAVNAILRRRPPAEVALAAILGSLSRAQKARLRSDLIATRFAIDAEDTAMPGDPRISQASVFVDTWLGYLED